MISFSYYPSKENNCNLFNLFSDRSVSRLLIAFLACRGQCLRVPFERAGDRSVICACALPALPAALAEAAPRRSCRSQQMVAAPSPCSTHTDTHWREFAEDTRWSWAAGQISFVKLLLQRDVWGAATAAWELTFAFSCCLANKLGIFPRASAPQPFADSEKHFLSLTWRGHSSPPFPHRHSPAPLFFHAHSPRPLPTGRVWAIPARFSFCCWVLFNIHLKPNKTSRLIYIYLILLQSFLCTAGLC